MRGEEVVAIGPSADHEEWLTDRGVRLVVGDHRLIPVLRTAGVADAAVLVLTIDDDLGNLNAALAACELRPDIRLVIRMFDQELGPTYRTSSPMPSRSRRRRWRRRASCRPRSMARPAAAFGSPAACWRRAIRPTRRRPPCRCRSPG